MAITHYDIAAYANRGEFASSGNLSTNPGGQRRYSRGMFSGSWMPDGLANALEALAADGLTANQTIHSFSTPIAMRFGDVWIMNHDNYSARTSAQIGKLRGSYRHEGLAGRIERVPGDISAEELRRVIDGKMRYVGPRTRGGIGSWVAA